MKFVLKRKTINSRNCPNRCRACCSPETRWNIGAISNFKRIWFCLKIGNHTIQWLTILFPFITSLCSLMVIHAKNTIPFSSKPKNHITSVYIDCITPLYAHYIPLIYPYKLLPSYTWYTLESNVWSQHHLGFVVEPLSSKKHNALSVYSLCPSTWPKQTYSTSRFIYTV